MMFRIKEFLTEGTSIKFNGLVGLYIPGVALSLWFYVFALGEVFSDFVLKFGVESRALYIALLVSLILASIVSGGIIDKTGKYLIITYMGLAFCGIISLLSFLITSATQLFLYSILVGAGGGVGITGLRVYLADITELEERGRVAGGLLFVTYVSIVFWKFLLKSLPLTPSILFLSLLCFGGCVAYFLMPEKISVKKKITAYGKTYQAGVYGKTLHYFLISWILFAGAYGIWNALITPHPISLISNIDNALFGIIVTMGYGFAALVGGMSIDWVGRKIVIVFAYAILAIAYVVYGLIPMFTYFAVFLEVVSWGFINTVYIFVIWGDISKDHMGLFYGVALGVFFGGFLLGQSLAITLGPVPWNYVSILSGALLILAIVPLLYSDEPLPKEKVKLREMASYMKEIKKLKI